MTHPFLGKLEAAWNPQQWRDLTVVVCVSAGPDSVALLRGLANLRADGPGRLVVAHFNHRLRGSASSADETFTRALCDCLELPLEVGSTAAQLTEVADASEANARAARYAFFEEVAKTQGARFVATAHTADDQAETILHRIVRGTGIGGLGGIPRTRVLATGITMLRPLLAFTRSEVIEFLESLPQPFREDSSNRDPRFTRNRIRAELLPELTRSYNPQVRRALLQLGTLAADSQQVVQSFCIDLLDRCVSTRSPDQVQICCQPLAAFPPAVLREVLIVLWKNLDWPQQEMGFDHWNQLAAMMQPEPIAKKRTLPGNIVATRHEKNLQLTRSG
ncbi:MAG TPA: tRNA lysidine(34) synthetase TilS [Pirellulaceae bacterium]|nr:tRNA lysidine(34) synthetase TilS [Pirellulaceae bacterium]